MVRAEPDEEDFEKRLARLNKSKLPTGVSRKDLKKDPELAGEISPPVVPGYTCCAIASTPMLLVLQADPRRLLICECPSYRCKHMHLWLL